MPPLVCIAQFIYLFILLFSFFLLDNVFSIELTGFKARRVVAFRKNLIEMAELEIKHAKVPLETLVILNCYLLPLDI